jgi:hypothetical protein
MSTYVEVVAPGTVLNALKAPQIELVSVAVARSRLTGPMPDSASVPVSQVTLMLFKLASPST